jgi:pilus assembly protein Flp/PilA
MSENQIGGRRGFKPITGGEDQAYRHKFGMATSFASTDKPNYTKKQRRFNMKTYIQKAMAFIRDEEGASAIEYALLVGLIALAIAGGASLLGGAINTRFGNLATNTAIVGS